jgi:LmbE family N-acetylglucosaminyl deacetylase
MPIRRWYRSLLISALLPIAATVAVSRPAFAQAAQPKQAGASPLPDERYKADILVVVAHPDDETLISDYLAKAVLDDHKRVEVVFTTRGNAGDNEVTYAQAAALADVREMEARHALASIGISNVWFLGAPDTPAVDVHNVLRSLETANHGAILGKLVRFMRLTRPSVVITFLPDVVAGENHEDHQASGVMATEAFDLAGDPTWFPEQLSFPDDRSGYGNLTEGLRPWQPEKLYYFSDAVHTKFPPGKGPEYSATAMSASRHVPYSHLKALEASFHLTQIGIGADGKKALETGNFSEYEGPEYFILGKSLVKSEVTGDILDGIVTGPLPFAPVRGYRSQPRTGISVELGDPWSFYTKFWQAHDLDHLAGLLPVPEIESGGGPTLPVQLLIHNDTDQDQIVPLDMQLPPGWTADGVSARYPVRAHDVYPVRALLNIPATTKASWQQVHFSTTNASDPGATVRVYVGPGGN